MKDSYQILNSTTYNKTALNTAILLLKGTFASDRGFTERENIQSKEAQRQSYLKLPCGDPIISGGH